MIGLIGKKLGMTRFFGPDGESIPVTAILAGPCHVVQIKTKHKEGYCSIQLGAFDRRKNLVRRPQRGHFDKAGVEPKARLAEFRVADTDLYHAGQEIRVNIFQQGDRVKVTGTSKGKGFAGGVKRWGFAGGPKTHGQSDRHRAPGSLGGSSYPSRVWKGLKMAGHMGSERVTVRNLEVVGVDLDRNVLLVKGAVPGARNGYLLVQRTTELSALPALSEEKLEKPISPKKKSPPASHEGAKGSQAPGAERKTSAEAPAAEKDEVPAQQDVSMEKSVDTEAAGKAEQKRPTSRAAKAQPTDVDKEAPEEPSQSSDVPPSEEKSGENTGQGNG